MNESKLPHYFAVQASWLVYVAEDRRGAICYHRICKIKDAEMFEHFIDACNARYAIMAGDAMLERRESTTN